MLKIYEWETDTYPEFILASLKSCEAEKLLRKLVRHFKTCPVRLTFRGYGFVGGAYGHNSRRISLPHFTSLSSVCHEFAHHLADTRHQKTCGHRKEFKRELKRVYTYAKRWLPEKRLHQMQYGGTSGEQTNSESTGLSVEKKEVV